MNKKQRLDQLITQGNSDERIFFRPILMHFAAKYIGKTYGEFASDYRTLVEANLRCLDDFDLDAVGLISDPYRETSAFGAVITFPDEAVPQCHSTIIQTHDDIDRLKNPDVWKAERTLDRIKAARELSKATSYNVPVIGWVEGPLAEACDLAGVNEVLLNTMMNPDFVKLLIDKVIITAKDFAKAQIDEGCDIIGVGDAICSQISAEQYKEFVKEKHQELFQYIHDQGARVKLHICGNISHLLDDIRETNPDIVDLDHPVDLDEAYQKLGEKIIRCGNLDPVSVIQGKKTDQLAVIVENICMKEKNRRFILSGGCEITVNTPIENLQILRSHSKISN